MKSNALRLTVCIHILDWQMCQPWLTISCKQGKGVILDSVVHGCCRALCIYCFGFGPDMPYQGLHNVRFSDSPLSLDEASTENGCVSVSADSSYACALDYRVIWLCISLVWVCGSIDVVPQPVVCGGTATSVVER